MYAAGFWNGGYSWWKVMFIRRSGSQEIQKIGPQAWSLPETWSVHSFVIATNSSVVEVVDDTIPPDCLFVSRDRDRHYRTAMLSAASPCVACPFCKSLWNRQQQSWSEVGTVTVHRCAMYSPDTRRPRVLRRSASSLEQPSIAHKTYLLHGRLLKELEEIFSVFTSILTVVFLSVFFVLCFYSPVRRPYYVFVLFTAP